MTQEEILRVLKESYSLYDTLLRKNYDVPEDLLKDIKALEKLYAEEVVLPQLEQQAAELLKDLRCELTLSIHKDINGCVSIHNESVWWNDVVPFFENEVHEEEPETTPEQDEEDSVNESESNDESDHQITRGARKKFKVLLNGQEVPGADGAHILAETIHRVGFRKVAALNIMHGEYNLVDRRKRTDGSNKWQQQVNDWFVYTNTSNPTKVKELREIAQRLDLDLQVINL